MPEFDTVMPPGGAFIYLNAADAEALRTTTTIIADTRYQIAGNYINLDLDAFTVTSGVLTYTGPGDVFALEMTAVQKSNVNNTKVHISWHHKPNGGVDPWEERPASRTGQFMSTGGEAHAHAPALDIVTLETGDQLKPMTWSDQAGAAIVATHIACKMRPWGR